MSVDRMSFQGGSAGWLLPVTLGTSADAGKYNGVGTAITYDALEKTEYEFPFTGSSSTQEFNSQPLAHGVTVEVPKVVKVLDAAGVEKAGSGSSAIHKMILTMTETDHQFLVDMMAIDDKPVIAVIPQGDTDAAGYVYLLGKPTGSVKKTLAGNTAQTVAVEFNGVQLALAAAKADADVVTDVTAAIEAVTQLGGAELDPNTGGPIVAGDVTRLLSGKLVFKKAA